MVVALYTTLHWRCSPQQNSYLVLPLLEIDTHLFLYISNLSTLHEPFPTKRQVCIYRKIRPSKHQITEQSPKLVLSDLSIIKKEGKKSLQLTSLPELIWLDVKLRTSPVLEMVRKWVWGTALRERQYGMLPRALLKHVPACYATLQPIFTVSVVAQLFEELSGCLERGSEIPCRGTLPSSPVAATGILPVSKPCVPSGDAQRCFICKLMAKN